MADEEKPGSGYRLWKDGGRAGDVYYVEDGNGELCFWWEFAGGGVVIDVPPPAWWDSAWAQAGKSWACGRREEILSRLIEWVQATQTDGGADVILSDDVIEVRFRSSESR